MAPLTFAFFVGLCLLAAVVATAEKAPKPKDAAGDWQTKRNEQGKVVQELKIEAPAMTEEDQYGYTMPERYRCDSCKAVMFHLDDELRKRHPKSRRMKQWEYTDLFDDACRDAFQGYGIKLIDGENTLSGPGLKEHESKIAPGSGAIQMGGESWTKRLAEVCRKLVYEKVGEEETYEMLYKKLRSEADGTSSDALAALSELTNAVCIKETRDCSTGPRAPPRPRPPPEEWKKQKKDGKIPVKKTETLKKSKNKEKPKAEPITEKPAANTAAAASSAASTRMDVQTYLRSLATKHGLPPDEYIMARTEREWDKLTLAMAGRIFSKVAESEADGSCSAA